MELPGYRENLSMLNEVYPLPKVMLTLAEAAMVCGVKPSTLKERTNLPLKKVGGRYKISKADLARWMTNAKG